MKFNQITKVLTPSGEIKEFTEGYVTFGSISPLEANCDCEDICTCDEECLEDEIIFVTSFFNKDKVFEGFCVNNETKDKLDVISNYMADFSYDLPKTCNDDTYPLLKIWNYKGISYTEDLHDCKDVYNTDNLNISDEFKKIFENHKEAMLINHIGEFEEYYLIAYRRKYSNFVNEIYDFSDEAAMLYEDLGNRHPNKDEYKHISKSLAPIISGYIEHVALGY